MRPPSLIYLSTSMPGTWSGVFPTCSCALRNIPGSHTWNTSILRTFCLVSYSFVFAGSRVGHANPPPQKYELGFLRRSSSQLLSLSLSTFWVFRFGNDNYRYRYRYRSYFGLIVSKRFWFRYPTTAVYTTIVRVHILGSCGEIGFLCSV